MPTPRVPITFKPAAQNYSIGAPDGVRMNDVSGGMPRVALQWSRGWQTVPIYRVMQHDEFTMWSLFFHRKIANGGIQFFMPMDLGQGMQDHLVLMVPGSYAASPLSGGKVWAVSFTVRAENPIYDVAPEAVDASLELWEAYGSELDAMLARIAKFATVDTLVLQ